MTFTSSAIHPAWSAKRKRLTLLATAIVGVLIADGNAWAQQRVITSDTELSAADNPIGGVVVNNGAALTGTGIIFNQSSNRYGVLVNSGTARLSGGSIEQAGTAKYVVGVGVVSGTAQIEDMDITINGAADAGGLYVNGVNAAISADNVRIAVNATGSSSAEPAAGIKGRLGTVSISNSTVSTTGVRTYGLFASGQPSGNSSIHSTANQVETSGDQSFGAYAFSSATSGSGTIVLEGGSITTHGGNAYGLRVQGPAAAISATDGLQITTSGDVANGAYIDGGGNVTMTGGGITTSGARAAGVLADQAGSAFTGRDVAIQTGGLRGYGVQANAGASVSLTGGSVTTANATGRGTQNGDGSRAYALYADGAGSTVSATGTRISTLGQRAYGAYALGGSQIDLNNASISTEGFMAYGVYASGAGSVLNANNVNVTTRGQVGDAIWAYDGGVVNVTGGVYQVLGERNPAVPNETASGLVAVGGVGGTGAGIINATGIQVTTTGANGVGLQVGGEIGTQATSGLIRLADSSITVNGANAYAAGVHHGSTLSATGSTLVARQGVGIKLTDTATVSLVGTTVQSAGQTLLSELNSAGQTQTIRIGDGSVATSNNGTLLQVNRSQAGGDGVVDLKLGAGSVTSGDIVDTDAKVGGGTDVTLEQGAAWTGSLRGVRNFAAAAGGSASFEDGARIEGDLSADGAAYTFGQGGATISGSVFLANGSTTYGGSVATPIIVAGDVGIDQTSIFGGNWNIGGDLDNAGVLSPGNSIGVVNVAGDVRLAPSSIYAVEVDASGNADRVNVGGTASLAGGVSVSAIDGILIGTPYTILTAGGGFAGTTFDSLSYNSDYAFIYPFLSYDANTVFLTMGRSDTPFAVAGSTPNQLAVAGSLDTLALTSPLVNAVARSSVDDVRAGLDSLSGEIHAAAKSALIEQSHYIRNAANARLRSSTGPSPAAGLAGSGSGAGVSAPRGSDGLGGWFAGFGGAGELDADSNAAKLDHSVGGFLAGLDVGAEDWRVGALVGYSRSTFDLDDRFSSGGSDNTHVGVYAGGEWGQVALRTGVGYSWHDIDTSRYALFGDPVRMRSSYDANTLQAFGELGYRLDAGLTSFEPFVNVSYVRLRTEDFREDPGIAALSGTGDETETLFGTLGLRASRQIGIGTATASLNGMVGWRHAFDDTMPVSRHAYAGGELFTVSGAAINENAAVIEAGLDIDLGPSSTLGLSYNGQLGSNVEHGFNARLGIRF